MSNAVLRSQESGRDRNGERIGTQTWYVPLRPADAARVYLSDNEGVDDDSQFPGDPTLKVDAIQDSASVDGVGTEFSVKYSTSGRFTFYQNPAATGDYIKYTRSWQVVKRQIPVNARRTYSVPQAAGDAITEKAWVIQWIFGGSEKQEIVEIEVEFEVKQNQFSTINKIGDQQNKIHKFASLGALYRFEAGPVRHIAPTMFACKYSWIGDPGTAITASMLELNNGDKLYFTLPVDPKNNYIRRPHHEFITAPSANPILLPAYVADVSSYDFTDPEGWKTLPGLPGNL